LNSWRAARRYSAASPTFLQAKETATMCEVFISADPQSYDARTRSVRLHGVVTSIRL